jgi:hypothetical protein
MTRIEHVHILKAAFKRISKNTLYERVLIN